MGELATILLIVFFLNAIPQRLVSDWEVKMDHMTHQAPAQSDPHTGHKMSNARGGHDRHAGHSVAMFRDKF